jgi:hypothetical protein
MFNATSKNNSHSLSEEDHRSEGQRGADQVMTMQVSSDKLDNSRIKLSVKINQLSFDQNAYHYALILLNISQY